MGEEDGPAQSCQHDQRAEAGARADDGRGAVGQEGGKMRGRVSGREAGRIAAACGVGAALLLVASLARCDTLDVLVGVSTAADLGSTEWALSRPVPPGWTIREGNPVMASQGVRMGLKTAGTVGILIASHKLSSTGHKRASRVLRWSAVVVFSGLAVNNALQARRMGGGR